MNFRRPLSVLTLIAGVSLVGTTAQAQDFSNQIGARMGEMKLLGANVGVLAGMARGRVDYDANMAQMAADNLVYISSIHQTGLWPEGSDNMALDTTRALPLIAEDFAGFEAKWKDLNTAAVALQAVASNGMAEMGPMIGPVGATCQACHETYRGPE